MSAVLSPKIIYLIVPQVKNLQSVKCEQITLNGWSVTYVLCQMEALPAWNYLFFVICVNLQKFKQFCSKPISVDSRLRFYWYETHLIPNFCPCRPSCWLFYTVLSLIRSELYWFGIRIQKHFWITFTSRTKLRICSYLVIIYWLSNPVQKYNAALARYLKIPVLYIYIYIYICMYVCISITSNLL